MAQVYKTIMLTIKMYDFSLKGHFSDQPKRKMVRYQGTFNGKETARRSNRFTY